MRSTRSGKSLSSLWLSFCVLIAASLIGCTTSAVHREGTVYNCDDEDHIRRAWADYDNPNLIVAQGESHSYSLLACAAQRNNKTLVNELLAAGADINIQDLQGLRPLSDAILPEMTKFLIEQGADVEVRDRSGATPLFRVVQTPYLDKATRLALIEIYLNAGANINIKNDDGNTLLHVVTSPAVARLLIGRGVPVDAQNKAGSTPLHSARAYTDNMGIAEALLQSGADANVQDRNGNTPLHIIACDPEICNRTDTEAELLIAFGADPTVKNNRGQSAQDLAIGRNRPELANLFNR